MKPNIYNFLDTKNNKVCYVGKHNGVDTSYITGSKILKRYMKMFGKTVFRQRFKKQIIEYCELAELNDREVYWIKQYGTYKNGLNLTKGGDYDWKYKMPKCKQVAKYDLNGNYIESYIGIIQAALKNSLCRTAVSDCVIGVQASSGGYMWRLLIGDTFPVKIPPYNKNDYKTSRESNSKWWIEYKNIMYPSVAKLCIFLTGKRYSKIPLHILRECKVYKRVIVEVNSNQLFDTINEASAYSGLKISTIQSKIVKRLPYKGYFFAYDLKQSSIQEAALTVSPFRYALNK